MKAKKKRQGKWRDNFWHEIQSLEKANTTNFSLLTCKHSLFLPIHLHPKEWQHQHLAKARICPSWWIFLRGKSKDLSVMVNLFERQTRNENEECTQTTPYHKRARRKKKALWTWRHRAAPSKLHASRRGAIPHTQHRKLNTSVDCLRNNHRHCFVSLRLKAAALVHSNSFIH